MCSTGVYLFLIMLQPIIGQAIGRASYCDQCFSLSLADDGLSNDRPKCWLRFGPSNGLLNKAKMFKLSATDDDLWNDWP